MAKHDGTSMAMNFFESQDVARKSTKKLVIFFALAVICMIALIYVAVIVIIFGSEQAFNKDFAEQEIMFNPMLIGLIGGGTLLLVGMGSLYKVSQLRGGGGASVAETLGGKLLVANSTNPQERKLLNVVEEMAIASGTPVPPVYVMENEEGINAFAAGYTSDDAVIGVSKGAMEILSRDELQGVIAHEFSHILNGDMRLNIRLIGLLYGILLIGLTGKTILYSMRYMALSRSSSNRKSGGGGQAVIVILAIAIVFLVLGFAGLFFSKLIKAAISRQREFLADASAVQFTRNPEGIGGALKKIGGLMSGSTITNPKAEEVSHMFFGQAFSSFSNMFATHPPLPERIIKVMPNWDGEFPEVHLPSHDERKEYIQSLKEPRDSKIGTPGIPGVSGAGIPGVTEIPGVGQIPGVSPQVGAIIGGVVMAGTGMSYIGQPTREHVEYAQQLVSQIPEKIKEATHEPYSARAVVYSLIINKDKESRDKQWQILEAKGDAGLLKATQDIEPSIKQLDVTLRIPIVDMCFPALKELSKDQYVEFRDTVKELVTCDRKWELFEFVIMRMIISHLEKAFFKPHSGGVKYYSLARLGEDCSRILSSLAHVGHEDRKDIEAAFKAGAKHLATVKDMRLMSSEECQMGMIAKSLDELTQTAPRCRQAIIEACATCIVHDHKVTVDEGELLRAIADDLGCPMPPLLPGQKLV